MTKEFVRDGKLDRLAAADALRDFLPRIVRAAGLELSVNVRVAEAGAGSVEGEAEIFADLDGKDNEFLMARSGEVLKAHVFAGAAHCTSRSEGFAQRAHRKRRHGRRTSGGYSPGEDLALRKAIDPRAIAASRYSSLPAHPTLRDHASVTRKPHAIRERRRPVWPYVRETQIRKLHHRFIAFLVKEGHGKPREP